MSVTMSYHTSARGVPGFLHTFTGGTIGVIPAVSLVDTDGNPVSGGGGGGVTAVATAAAPTYAEGSTDALSLNLSGNLRTIDASAGTKLDTMITALQDTTTPSPVNINQTTQGTTNGVRLTDSEYETVAASQTDQILGATGATGDYLSGLLIVPATTSPGAVSIKDGSGSAITVFTGGASSVSGLVPFFVPLGIKCTGAAWKVTTGANVSAIGVGDFT